MARCIAKSRTGVFSLCILGVILSLSLLGCGGTFRSFPNEGDISGGWNLFLASSGVSAVAPKVLTLAQSGGNITGTTGDGAIITGTIDGDYVALDLANSDKTATTLTGTISSDWKTMSGTYTSTGSDGSGTWNAAKIAPIAPLAATPTSANLSCSGTTGATSATFTVTGGTLSKYSVTASTNAALLTLATTTLTTNGQFTVTANACSVGGVVNLAVTDASTSITVPVTVLNP